MKNLITIFAIVTLLFSCSNEDSFNNTSGIYGKWKLVANHVDIGGGDTTFKNVHSNKTITFLKNNTFTSSDDICNLGYFTIDDNIGFQDRGLIIPENCPYMNPIKVEYDYEVNGNELIINYQCIEVCRSKYIRVEDETTSID